MSLKTYLERIEENRKNGTEHTFRTALKNYLDSVKSNRYVSIDEELKKEALESYAKLEQQKAKENKKYHMYQY